MVDRLSVGFLLVMGEIPIKHKPGSSVICFLQNEHSNGIKSLTGNLCMLFVVEINHTDTRIKQIWKEKRYVLRSGSMGNELISTTPECFKVG